MIKINIITCLTIILFIGCIFRVFSQDNEKNRDDHSINSLHVFTDTQASKVFGNGCGNGGGGSGFGRGKSSNDPVELTNGNLYFDHTDLEYPSRGLDVEVTRRYNAQQISFLQNWFVDDGAGSWTIENGNLSGQGDILLSNNEYSKSIIEVSFRTVDPGAFSVESAWINFRYTDKTKRYIVILRQDGTISLLKHDSSEYQDVLLASLDTSFSPLDWNKVKIIDDIDDISGGVITIYLNDILVIEYIENNPLPLGKIALESRYSHAHYDDIKLTDSLTNDILTEDFNYRDLDYPFGNWTSSYNSHL